MGDAFEQAKAIHEEGRLNDAVIAYRQLLQTEPDNFKALNNLGTVYEEKEDYSAAVASYRQALRINPEAAPVHFNLGHALQEQGKLEAAIDAYETVLELRPNDPAAYYNIGHAYHDIGDLDSAETAYRKAIEQDAELFRAHSNLGSVLFDQERLTESATEYRRAIVMNPDSAADHFNLGKVLEVQGKLGDAAQKFRDSLGLNPLSATAYERLAAVENKLERPDKAEDVFKQWLSVMPNHPVALHLQAAARGDQSMSRASEDYVRTTFDSFAGEFDKRLANLDYIAPQVLGQCVADLLESPAGDLSIVDIGCGTGLCGPYLRPYARQLTGVDISPAMLAEAKKRGEYDVLIEAELANFLTDNQNGFDLIVSADVLIYFGDLQPVFDATAKALRSGGSFLCTLEYAENANVEPGYFLNRHGRYSHSESYVRDVLRQAGLSVKSLSIRALRKEGGQAVNELVVIAGLSGVRDQAFPLR